MWNCWQNVNLIPFEQVMYTQIAVNRVQTACSTPELILVLDRLPPPELSSLAANLLLAYTDRQSSIREHMPYDDHTAR